MCNCWKKSYIKEGDERGEQRVFIICCLVLSHIFQGIMEPKKKRKKENGNLRNCTIKKMNGWNEDMIYGEFIHTFLCMLCLMSLYYSAVISSSALFFLIGFMSLKVIWWPIYCVLSEIQFGEVPLDIRYGNTMLVSHFYPSILKQHTRTDSNKQAWKEKKVFEK